MASIPGYCPHCGHVFKGHGGIHIENSIGVVTAGNRMTCPNCGRVANSVDGTFNELGKGLEIVSAPPITHAVIAALSQVAERARAGEITEKQALDEAKKVDPALASIIDRFSAKQISVVALLLTLITILQQCAGSISDARFQREVIERMDRQIELMEQQNSNDVSNISSQSPTDQLHTGSTEKAKPKRPPPRATKKSDRRAVVNRERRKALRESRRQFKPR